MATGGWPAAGVPVLVFQHGLNASRAQVAAVANDQYRAGSPPSGSTRSVTATAPAFTKDERQRVHAGPDGLADGDAVRGFDHSSTSRASRPRGSASSTRAVRDNFRQAVVDLTVFARLLAHGDLSASPRPIRTSPAWKLDTSRLVYTGESFGSILGIGALLSPTSARPPFSVGGGGIFLNMMARSPIFARLVTPFVQAAFDDARRLRSGGVAARRAALARAPAGGDHARRSARVRAAVRGAPEAPVLLQARADEAIPNESESCSRPRRAPRSSSFRSAARRRASRRCPRRVRRGPSRRPFVQLARAAQHDVHVVRGRATHGPETVLLVRLPAPQSRQPSSSRIGSPSSSHRPIGRSPAHRTLGAWTGRAGAAPPRSRPDVKCP